MLGKSYFYKIVLFLIKTITHKFWTCKNDFALFFFIKLTIVTPPPSLSLSLEMGSSICSKIIRLPSKKCKIRLVVDTDIYLALFNVSSFNGSGGLFTRQIVHSF